jgi:predicted DNA binding CopG/RHH family protein
MANYQAKGRPRLQKNRDAVRLSITLSAILAREIKREARKKGLNISEYIRELYFSRKD